MQKHFSAGGLLINSKNEIFLIHQLTRDEWALPKGTIEDGEEISETAKREIKEETGYINISLLTQNPFHVDTYNMTHPQTKEDIFKTVYYFIFTLENEDRNDTEEMKNEHLEGNWFSLEEALNKVSFPNLKKVIAKGQESINQILQKK